MPIDKEIRIDSVSGDSLYVRLSDDRFNIALSRGLLKEQDGEFVMPLNRLLQSAIPDSAF